MSRTEIVQRAPIDNVVDKVRAPVFMEQIKAALPGNMAVERFVRVTVTALRENPDLAGAEQASLFSAVVRCAQDGLLPDSREAALVKFRDNKKGCDVAVYMPMIGGLRKIAAEFGWSLRTRVVYENDTFDYSLGMDETLVHQPTRPGLERGPMVAAYAVATHKDGRREIDVMYEPDIAKARAVSRAKDYGPWVDWPEAMWEKTVGKRIFKKLPLGDRERVESILSADEPLAPGEAKALLYGHKPTEVPPREENGTEQAAGEVVQEGPSTEAKPTAQVASETDGTPAPAPAEGTWQIASSFGVDGYEVITPDGETISGYESHADAEAAIAGFIAEAEPEPGPEEIEEGQFTAPEGVGTNADVEAANEAAEVALPDTGKYKKKLIREVAESGEDGVGYLRFMLRRWSDAQYGEFKASLWAYVKVFHPDIYAEVKAEWKTEAEVAS